MPKSKSPDAPDTMTLTARLWTVRPARREDQATLAKIYLTVRQATFTWIDPGHFREEDFAIHTRGEQVFICEDKTTGIVGLLALWEPEDFIHMLYVLPIFQGQGAGSALLRMLPGWPRRRYRLKCLVNNKRALAFYGALGFEVIGSGVSSEGDYKDMQLGTAAGRAG